MKLTKTLFPALTTLLICSGSEAALVSRLDGKAIYDTETDLTWLQATSPLF